MKYNIGKRAAGVILLFSFVFNVFSACGITENRTKTYVAIIAKSTTSAYWKTTFAGAKAASAEYNLEITIEGPENEEDYD